MIYSARPKPHSSLEKQPLASRQLSRQLHRPARLEGASTPAVEEHTDQFDFEMASLIISRIESRLPGRVRHLTVYTTENAVILSGECSTFYTKQVAQHAAMGVLEYEQLINNIDVRTVK